MKWDRSTLIYDDGNRLSDDFRHGLWGLLHRNSEVRSGSLDEIAAAITRCAGVLADSVAIGESIDT